MHKLNFEHETLNALNQTGKLLNNFGFEYFRKTKMYGRQTILHNFLMNALVFLLLVHECRGY